MKNRIVYLSVLVLLFSLALPVGAAEKPLSLSESINLALANNLDLQLSQSNIDIAASRVKMADAAKKPNLALTTSYTRTDKETSSSYRDTYGSKIGFNYPLYLYSGGKLEAAVKAEKYGLKSAEYGLQTTARQLVYRVKEAYYGVLRHEQMLKVARENLTGMESHLKVAEAMYKSGMAPRFDVLKAEVGVLEAKQQLIKSKNSLNLAKASFNDVLHRDLNTPVHLVDVMEIVNLTEKTSLSQLVEKAYQQRPEMAQWAVNLKAEEENIKYAKGDKKPNLVLTGGYGWQDKKFFPGKNSWSLTLSSTFTILDAGIIDNQIKQAEYKRDQVRIRTEQAKQSIALEVRKAYLNLEEAQEALATAKKTVEQAKEGLKIAQVRYKAGMGTSVERLDAQVDLTQAETQYVQALYDYNLAKAQLEKATGENQR